MKHEYVKTGVGTVGLAHRAGDGRLLVTVAARGDVAAFEVVPAPGSGTLPYAWDTAVSERDSPQPRQIASASDTYRAAAWQVRAHSVADVVAALVGGFEFERFGLPFGEQGLVDGVTFETRFGAASIGEIRSRDVCAGGSAASARLVYPRCGRPYELNVELYRGPHRARLGLVVGHGYGEAGLAGAHRATRD